MKGKKMIDPHIRREQINKTDRHLTSGLFCRGASVETRSFVFGRSLGSYCKHREARSKTTVASSDEKFPSKCESIK